MSISKLTIFILCTVLCVPCLLFADQTTIKDSSGEVRYVSESSKADTLEFSVMGKEGADVSGSVVSLTNEATGEVILATVIDGVATFSNVAPGVYTVTSATEGLVFVNIGAAGATAGGSIIPVVAGGLLVTGGVVAIASNDSSDSTPLSPSN